MTNVYPYPNSAAMPQPMAMPPQMVMPRPMAMAMPQPPPWLPPPSAPAGCPAGLEHFVDLDEFHVMEYINLTEFGMVVMPNRYSIRNAAGQQIYFVEEALSPNQSYSDRQIDLTVSDSNKRVCMTLRRVQVPACNCCGCCSKGALAIMEVRGADGSLLGEVHWTCCCCCDVRLSIRNEAGVPILTAISDFNSTNSRMFNFEVSAIGSKPIGAIRRAAANMMQQMYNAQNYIIKMPKDLAVKAKALLLATVILSDYSFFESSYARYAVYYRSRGYYY